jgi:hypothetical protein
VCTYTSGSGYFIRIEIPCGRKGDWLHPQDSFISFKFNATWTGGTAGSVSLDGNIMSLFKKDVKKICKCNPRELNLVVNLVLKRLPDVCTKQGIWNVMMEVIGELELQIKSSKESEFFQEVEFASSKCQAEKVIDLPTADFATLMKIKETKQKGGLNKIQKAISRSFSTRAANTLSLPRSPRVEDLSNLSQDERPSCLDQEECLSRIHISYV